jgi:2-oxo-hept-3-ene-1,7-dioate hydratase
MSGETSNAALARSLYESERTVRKAPALRSRRPDLTLADAYLIQREVDALREAAGERPIGWKIGLASREFMARMGASEPFWARMYSGRVFDNGAVIEMDRYHHARFEPELGLVLGSDLAGPGVTSEQARAAIRAVRPAFEIVDTRANVEGLVVVEAVADSGSFAGVVLGPEVASDGLDLDAITIVVREGENGETVTHGAAAVLADGPAGILAWLANQVGAAGMALRAGEIVLAGTMTGAHAITEHPAVVAYSGLGPQPIEVRVSGR